MRYLKLTLGFVWALPTTLIGLLLAVLGGARPYALRPAGAWWWVQSTRWWGWGWMFNDASSWEAITFGFVTVGNRKFADDPVVIRHERQHLLQATRLGGAFLPVYLWQWATGLARDGLSQQAYMDIPLEEQAYAAQGQPDAWG